MLNQTIAESISEMRKFFNHRELPATKIVELLGRQTPAALLGGMKLLPHDRRFAAIVVSFDPRNANVIRYVAFTCPEHPVGLDSLEKDFGELKTQYDEKSNVTTLTFDSFEEEEAIQDLTSSIEAYRMDKVEGGLELHQPGGGTVVVPTSEIQLPFIRFNFKPFERPTDPGAAGQSNFMAR